MQVVGTQTFETVKVNSLNWLSFEKEKTGNDKRSSKKVLGMKGMIEMAFEPKSKTGC